MREDGSITKQEEATLNEAMQIMDRWLDAHRHEAAHSIGYWGVDEALHQLKRNLGFMRGE